VLVLHDQRVRDDQHRVADEGQGRGERHPLEDTLLRLRHVVEDGPLDEVARGVGRGQRLAPGARRGRLGDISIRIRRGDAARGEGGQEEDEQDDGIGVLQHRHGLAQARGRAPSQVVGEGARHGGVADLGAPAETAAWAGGWWRAARDSERQRETAAETLGERRSETARRQRQTESPRVCISSTPLRSGAASGGHRSSI
jgi:hypothetical protein